MPSLICELREPHPFACFGKVSELLHDCGACLLRETAGCTHTHDPLGEVLLRELNGNRCLQAGKYELTQSLGVHLRDLRILDTNRNPSYASCILCRERALVINLEFIQVLHPNYLSAKAHE